jgi:integrase
MKTAQLTKKKVRIKDRNGKKNIFWKVTSPKLGGGSTRRFFKDEAAANTYLEQQETQLGNYGMAGANLTEKLRMSAIAADEILSPLGLELVDAAKHYAAFINSSRGGMPLTEAIEKLLKNRSSEDYSPEYRKSLTHRLGHFSDAFPGKSTTALTKADIHDFLSGIKNPETRKSYRRNIKTVYQYLIDFHNHTVDPVPALEKAKSVKETKWSVEVIMPEECSMLLNSATPETLPSLAIAMFCGLRASECERLDWKNISLEEKRIRIDENVARKVGSKRTVPIPDNCIEWLRPYAKKTGKVQPEDFHDLFEEVRIAAGFRPSNTRTNQRLLNQGHKLKAWPSNCLRHSAISYALADCGDESKVSTWAGNSPAMTKKHYDAQANPSAAKRFYSLRPEKIKKGKIHHLKVA